MPSNKQRGGAVAFVNRIGPSSRIDAIEASERYLPVMALADVIADQGFTMEDCRVTALMSPASPVPSTVQP
jgi:hypothetical protein